MTLADIASGEVDWADIFFLVAVIFAAVAAVLAFQAKALPQALAAAAVGFAAAGLLVL